ncbi:MAG TPA: LapA family protein [Actinomycetota bacterium]
MRRDDDMGGADRGKEEWTRAKEGPSGKLIGAGIAAILLLIFVLQNTNDADIDFLFWDGEVSLWVLIVVSAVLGFAIGWFLGRGSGKRAAIRKID